MEKMKSSFSIFKNIHNLNGMVLFAFDNKATYAMKKI